MLRLTGISSWASHARPAPCSRKGCLAARRGHDHDKAARTLRMTQISEAPARTRAQIAERTLRKDPWWNRGRVVATLLTIWVAYATVRVFTGHWYYVPQYHYLTPFYSPCVSGECVPGSSASGTGFRRSRRSSLTRSSRCRSCSGSGCPATTTAAPTTGRSGVARRLRRARAAREVLGRDQGAADHAEPAPVLLLRGVRDRDPHHLRRGAGVPRAERRLRHRPRLASSCWSTWWRCGHTRFSCHSCRHITGGRLKHFSKHPVRYWAWTQISKLNKRHMASRGSRWPR